MFQGSDLRTVRIGLLRRPVVGAWSTWSRRAAPGGSTWIAHSGTRLGVTGTTDAEAGSDLPAPVEPIRISVLPGRRQVDDDTRGHTAVVEGVHRHPVVGAGVERAEVEALAAVELPAVVELLRMRPPADHVPLRSRVGGPLEAGVALVQPFRVHGGGGRRLTAADSEDAKTADRGMAAEGPAPEGDPHLGDPPRRGKDEEEVRTVLAAATVVDGVP